MEIVDLESRAAQPMTSANSLAPTEFKTCLRNHPVMGKRLLTRGLQGRTAYPVGQPLLGNNDPGDQPVCTVSQRRIAGQAFGPSTPRGYHRIKTNQLWCSDRPVAGITRTGLGFELSADLGVGVAATYSSKASCPDYRPQCRRTK